MLSKEQLMRNYRTLLVPMQSAFPKACVTTDLGLLPLTGPNVSNRIKALGNLSSFLVQHHEKLMGIRSSVELTIERNLESTDYAYRAHTPFGLVNYNPS